MSKKLPVRVFQPVFGLFMATFMSFLMSGAITALNIGLNGAAALYGVTSGGSLTAATPFRIRFYQATNSWYRVV